jgi:hypothetical protein
MKKFTIFLHFCLAAIVVAVGCSQNNRLSGTQITNGNCMGKIYNKDGSTAGGALVRLIPSNYNPYSPSDDSMYSTITDNEGSYGFSISHSNYYNILAEKGEVSCIQESIAVAADGRSLVANDTLKVPGKMAGKILLKPEDDPRSIVILIVGTNVFTQPSDTAGDFITPMLPAGDYKVTIFSTRDGYDVLDTSITIVSDDTAELNARLPTSYAPAIIGFAVNFDSVTMMAKIQWAPIDTSLIRSYALYRTMAVHRDTVIMLDRTLSSYTDDLVLRNRDTVEYGLAAIGKNYKEGYKASSKRFVACGKVNCNTAIDSGGLPSGFGYGSIYSYFLVYADSLQNTYWKNRKSLVKLDPRNTRLREYVLPELDSTTGSALAKKADTGQGNVLIVPDDFFNTYGDLQTDNGNHLFCLAKAVNTANAALIKLDVDLNVIDTMFVPRDTNETMDKDLRMVVTGAGAIYLLWTGHGANGAVNHVDVYNSDFEMKRKFTLDKALLHPKCFGDTIVALTYTYTGYIPEVPSKYTINVFDTALTLKSSFDAIDPSGAFCSSALCNDNTGKYSQVILMPGNMYIATINSDITSYVVFDFQGNVRARIAASDNSWCFFIDRSTMYQSGGDANYRNYWERYSVSSLFAK